MDFKNRKLAQPLRPYYQSFQPRPRHQITSVVSVHDKKIEHPLLVDYRGTALQEETPCLQDGSVKNNAFIKGWHYILQDVGCEGFDMPYSEYEFITHVDEFAGVEINGVIMRFVGGAEKQRYTLTRHDCDILGIEYQESLELFPRGIEWQRKKPFYKEFNPNDLSSAPLDETTGLIRQFVFEFEGIESFPSNNNYLRMGDILIKKCEDNPFIVVANRYFYDTSTHGDKIVSHSNGESFSSVLKYVDNKPYLIVKITEKGSGSGLNPDDVNGMEINDLFSIYIEDSHIISIDKYTQNVKNVKFAIGQLRQRCERINSRITEYDISSDEGRKKYIESMECYYKTLHNTMYGTNEDVQNPFKFLSSTTVNHPSYTKINRPTQII